MSRFASPEGVIFVVDGAGGYEDTRRAVATAVAESGTPFELRSFIWSHGRGRILADEVDAAFARSRGQQLAREIEQYQATNPGIPVYVLAHSAGSAVALAAAESTPPDALERVVLLAPAVSEGYDLRPALAGSRKGIDVYVSARDVLWLGIGAAMVGTADGRRQAAAGRVGFDPPADPLVSRLHQHPWDQAVAWTGNRGGHRGTLNPAYLRAYVLPLFSRNA
jgi:pimeloyl-ACP methyl ester carboxylesterase